MCGINTDLRRKDLYEVFQSYSTIIDLQKDIIDDLFILLMRYASVEEIDNHPCIEKINLVANLRKEEFL